MVQPMQPFLHDLVTAFAAPTQVWSDRGGDVVSSTEGPGASGVIHADVRVVSDLRLTVDGHSPEYLSSSTGPGTAEFSAVVRRVNVGLPAGADPQLRLDRRRTVTPGMVTEEVCVSSRLAHPVCLTVELTISSDFTAIEDIKTGSGSTPVAISAAVDAERLTWRCGALSVTLEAEAAKWEMVDERRVIRLSWPITVPALGDSSVMLTLGITDSGSAVVAATTAPLLARALAAKSVTALSQVGVADLRLQPWLEQSLNDLNSLRMATVSAPDDTFFAAGAPWYFTLFGRDSLWTARLLLPLDVSHAGTTLRTLARLQGTVVNPDTAESPGKIMHELRRSRFTFGSVSLPPLYYGTIDATPLWVCLLHDAWRADSILHWSPSCCLHSRRP